MALPSFGRGCTFPGMNLLRDVYLRDGCSSDTVEQGANGARAFRLEDANCTNYREF
jgi:hypothetical protein